MHAWGGESGSLSLIPEWSYKKRHVSLLHNVKILNRVFVNRIILTIKQVSPSTLYILYMYMPRMPLSLLSLLSHGYIKGKVQHWYFVKVSSQFTYVLTRKQI